MRDLTEQIANLPAEKRRLLELLLLEETKAAPPRGLAAKASATAPLSFAQQRLWFFQQALPGVPVHHLSSVLRLEGALDVAALERSLVELVRRHEALRTIFPAVDGLPHQLVIETPERVLELTDLGHLPEEAREAEALRLAGEEGRRAFDLARGPLLRARALRLGEAEHLVVFTTHHIVSDGWSQGLIVREVSELYRAHTTGTPAELPPLPIQYADFAAWERERLESGALDHQREYWRRALAGAAPLELPLDRPRPAAPGFRSAGEDFELPESLSLALRELSRREGVTLYMTLLASFDALLHSYTGQEDVSVGSSVANRTRAEIEGLVGCFVNMLVLRVHVAGDPTVRELLGRVREVCLDAYANAELPFERVVAELHPERSLQRNPLFQVAFILLNAPAPEMRLPGLTLRSVEVEQDVAENDLSLMLVEEGERLTGRLTYNTELFDAGTARQMLGHWRRLLEAFVADPARRLSELRLLSADERRQILHDWNATATGYERDRCVHELFEAQAARTPEAVALADDSVRLTYAELNRRANRLARRLASLGVGPETRVGLCVERSAEMVVAMLAVLKAGGAYVPLDPSYPLERLSLMLEDSAAAVLVTEERLADALPATWATVVCLDAEWDSIAEEGDEDLGVGAGPDNLAYVIYTSGSTGRPKGVAVTHRGVARLVRETDYVTLTGRDVVLQFASVSFDASTFEIWGALLNGARLVVPPARAVSPEELAGLIRRHRVTTLWLTAALFHQMVEHDADALAGVEQLLAGGDVLRGAHVQKMLERMGPRGRLVNGYGPTENTTFTCCHVMPAGTRLEGPVPIGRPVANTRVYVLDRHLNPVPRGVAGELYTGGDGLARGYLNDPRLTAEKFVPDPFSGEPGSRLYRTGDLARFRPDGTLEFLGRRDAQVKVRGFRVEPGEVEDALLQHPAVREAAVVARDEPPGEKRLVAYVVAQPGADAPAPDALREFLRRRLPEYMLPSAFAALDALPVTPNGKVDRRALPAPEASRPELAQAFAPPAGRVELLLADVWSRVLGVERVGAHDNFFDLGGDSILSIRVCALAKAAGLDVSVQQLFDHQTVGELARAVGQNGAGPGEDGGGPAGALALVSESDRARMPDGVVAAYPLTRLQAGMLFHSGFDDETTTYHDIFSYRLGGPCDPDALREVLREVVARHEVLRTSFDLTSFGEPLQLVHAEVPTPLEVEDLRALPAAEQERVVAARLAAERLRRFDWARPPLARCILHLRGEQDFQLTLSFHHAVLDGWSLASLLTEIFNHYTARLRGAPPPDAAPPQTTFRDYVALELAALASDEQRAFWAEKLAGSSVAKLPRRPGPSGPPAARRVRGLDVPLGAELCGRLRRLARDEGATLKSVLLAAHLRVLSFVCAQEDVLTGVVSNGRPETADGERLLGLFLNTLPFRLRLPGGTWRELVRETFAAEREVLPFRRYPLAEIQRAHSGGEPLFETCFNFTHYHVFRGMSGAGELRVLDSASEAETNFALLVTFDVDDATPEIRLGLGYDPAALHEEQAAALGRYYAAVLGAMAADPSARYEQHSPLDPAERRRLVVEWNRTRMDYPRAELLHQQFEDQAARTPDHVALVSRGERWTYRELNERANRLAHHLRGVGVGPEVQVGVLMGRTPLMVVAILGVLKAGGAYLPLDPEYPRERLAFMLEDSSAAVLLTEQRLLDRLPPHRARVVCVDAAREALERESAENPACPASPRNLAYVIYTSGSTGRPKGVAIEHRNAAAFLAWARTVFDARSLEGVLFATSVCFDLSVFELFAPLACGGKVVLAENALELSSLPSAGEVTLLNLVPSALSALLQTDAIPPTVSTINLAGEPLGLELVRRAYAKPHVERVFNLYGPSEDTTYSTGVLLDRHGNAPPPIGRPIANTQVYVLDRHSQPVPAGTPGLLYLGGDGLARGYFNASRLTAERFVPDPFADEPGSRLYFTGDLARWLPDGNLEFLGRADHQVKLRGYRIELGEIEATLGRHPAVRDAAVTARDEGDGEKRLVAYVVARAGEGIDTHELQVFLRDRLPGYMIPSAFVSLDTMPLTPNGKVNRAALPAPERGAANRDEAAAPPRDLLELRLARMWAELLGVPAVGPRDNFFLDLGGHSILAVRLAALVEKELGRRLPLATFLRGATVEELALALRRGGAAEPWTPLAPINPRGTRPPFFCVHPATGGALCYVHLARHLGREQPFYGLQAPGLDGAEAPRESVEELAALYVEAVRAVQPEGPYALGGHSFGGLVAYEMARQLRAAGCEVATLAILDTMAPAPAPPDAPEDTDDVKLLCEIARVYERFLGRELSVEYAQLKRLGPEERLSFVLERLRGFDLFPPDAGPAQVRGLLRVVRSNVRAARRYHPRPFDGEIALFRAAELRPEDAEGLPPGSRENSSLGWESLTRAPVRVRVVAGDHINMITEPHVSGLAAQLRAHLDARDRRGL